MPGEIQIKKGDRFPALESQLAEAGTPINLESPVSALAVKLRIKKVTGGTVETKSGTGLVFVSRKEGKVKYEWQTTDVSGGTVNALGTLGEYQYEWIIEWSAGVEEHFPSSSFKTFEVVETL